jgi:hypothetical protein
MTQMRRHFQLAPWDPRPPNSSIEYTIFDPKRNPYTNGPGISLTHPTTKNKFCKNANKK